MFLMLDFKFKSLHLVYSFVGHKEIVTIVNPIGDPYILCF